MVFEPGDPPRSGRITCWHPEARPQDAADELEVVVPHGNGVRRRTVPARRIPLADALPLLIGAPHDEQAHPSAAFWGAAALLALHLVARGRLQPTVSAQGYDAWRAGPLDPEDHTRIHELAEAMPPEARATPLPDGTPTLPDAAGLLRGFLDAVADILPRGTDSAPAFASVQPRHVPELRDWAEQLDSGVRISLRLESRGEHHTSFTAIVQVHSLADPTLLADAARLWEPGEHGFGERAPIDTMLAVRRAALLWPALEPLLHTDVPDEIALHDEELGELLGGAGARLAAAGVEVHWPRDLVRELTAQAVIGTGDVPPSEVPGLLGGGHLLEFNWRLALHGEPLSQAEMDQLAEATRPVVRLRDQWMLVDPGLIRKARERELKPLTAIDALGVALSGTAEVDGERVEVASSGWLETLRQRISEPEHSEPVAPPEALTAQLRDYQLAGLRWLARMTRLGLGGCLADDMGLGKTITLIALHLHRQADAGTAGPTLVVCPASLLGNWEREIARFAPGTPAHRFHGTDRSLDSLPSGGFVLTTYSTMRLDAERLASVHWGLVVADEAQHVKNPSSSTAKALRDIHAGARVALTGTPVENNLSELWAILDWTTPGLLGNLNAFRERWAKPIESDGDTATAERLSRLIRPFLLRRKKTDPGIAPELPAKTETDQPVALSREQAGLYEAVVRETMAQISGAEGMARRGLVMKLLTSLKQICNHPVQYLKQPGELPGRSGKLELLDELLDTITAEDGAVLVFTQYVAMARLLEQHLTGRGFGVQLLHGGTPVAQRERMVQRFQDGAAPVFLLSLKAAGTGLNLTRADHVVHYDRWWNPAVEEQATDRAYRIGQTKPVQVHRLIAEGTVEDRIAEMLRTKRELADAVLTSGEAALTELSNAELAELVELR